MSGTLSDSGGYVTVTAIPEPFTYLLVATGLASLAFLNAGATLARLSRRRRKL